MRFARYGIAQRGAAVIMVLLIVAIATSLAAFMAVQQDLWQRQVENQFNWAQARLLAIAGTDWARAILADDASNNNYDYPGEMWAQPISAIPLEKGELMGAIEDQQGLFNLNNLVRGGVTSPADVTRFQRLLGMLDLPPELAYSLADWMDADNDIQHGGSAEDAYYLSLPKPYRAANRPLAELSELLLVKGYDLQILDRLRPYVTVLPVPTAINVNFAPPEVMSAVLDNLALPDARMMAQQRIGRPYKTVADFTERLTAFKGLAPDGSITVSSQFFMVKGYVNVENSQVKIEALLQRMGPGWPTVVWQSVQ
jgi:general secretion pathway protein K